MYETRKLLFFFLTWAFFSAGGTFAQIELSGKVIDKVSGEPVALCNIALASSSMGTASNELGEFVIVVDSLPTKLIFSHINYIEQSIVATKGEEIKVSLVPLTTNLEEVVVTASKKDAFAVKLAKNAIEKAQKPLGKDLYGRAFYRQKSKNGDSYSEFSEIFYDIRYNNVGIKEWNIIEGRYALKENAVHNRNYTSFSRLLKPLQPNTEELIFPTHPNFEVFYNARVTGMLPSGDSKIAIVHFRPLPNITTPIFDAEVYIDIKTHEILKIKGELARDDIELAKLTTKNGYWKAYSICYEIVYNRQDGKMRLDYIKVDQAFDYYKDNSFQYHTLSTSNLVFYEHYTPTSRKRLGSRPSRSRSDWKELDKIGYNESFWAENPIVKRTPVEEEVIEAFEQEDAFSSIFLNSAENIAMMTSNLGNDPFIKEMGTQTNRYNNHNPVEKVFLHTDKDLFSPGETIWYSTYVTLGPFHQYSTGSKVLHVDLIDPDGKILLSQTHGLINGKGSGSLQIPKNSGSGNYQLRAYTQWMRNFDHNYFFTKRLRIPGKKNVIDPHGNQDQIDLQFFPEGGHAVADIAGKIAFKAIGNDGLPQNVKGRIMNANGTPVATFNTFDRGAGFFQFIPRKGEDYVARLDDGTVYPFPEILENGYSVAINNLSEKSIKVIVQASESLRGNPFYVVGHMRQHKYYQGKFEFGLNRTFTFEIPKTRLPSGILTLTLFDHRKKPWCERAVFVNNREELVIDVKTADNKLVERGKIRVDLKVTDTEGRPVATNLSMAVTDAGQVKKTKGSGTILTQLLLESDLKGHVTDPGLLLNDQKRTTLQQLDLVMLTHAWRKYHWPEIWEERIEAKEFDFANGLVITGRATGTDKDPLSNTYLNLVAKSGELLGMLSTKTALDGSFLLDDFNFNGPTEVVFNAFDFKDRPLDAHVDLYTKKSAVPPTKFKDQGSVETEETETYSSHTLARQRMETLYEAKKVTELDEVVVTEEKRVKSRNQSPSIYGQTPDATLYTADHIAFQTVLQLVGLFPSVTVSGNSVSIRNRGNPLWVLNGIPVYNDNPPPGIAATGGSNSVPVPMEVTLAAGRVPSIIATMDTFTVERVEILKGPSAAIWGSRGANGVILIYTKKGEGQTYDPVLSPDFTIEGHASKKEFYSPKYDVKRDEHRVADYRATLYWNPNITTDQKGRAQIEFFNSDIADQIQVSIEGLSDLGIPGTYLGTLDRKGTKLR